MLCQIADLLVNVSVAGGIAPRLKPYETEKVQDPQIIIHEDMYQPEMHPTLTQEQMAYMQSGWIFYSHLVKFSGMMLHASAVELNGEAYLFSGPSGMGKSTHTKMWEDLFLGARVFNDDKPALRLLDGKWYAYGTPWSGKGQNINVKVPLKAICFLRRGDQPSIRRLSPMEALSAITEQTIVRFHDPKLLDLLADLLNQLLISIPIYELIATKDPNSALLSHKELTR